MATTIADLQAILRLKDELSPTVKLAADKSAVSFGFLQQAGSRLFDTFLDIGKSAIAMAGQFEQTRIAFTTMLGSGEAATAFLKELERFAAETPFEFPDLTRAAQKLVGMGFAAKDVIPTMRSIGDAVAGVGGSSENINRVVTALGQMTAKGKLSAQEMNQLAENNIAAWKYVADAIGVSIPEAMKLAEKGAISASVGVSAIVKGMGTEFKGMMEAQSQTLMGQWSTLKDDLNSVVREMGTAVIPVAKEVLTWFKDMVPVLKEAGAGVADFAKPFATTLIAAVSEARAQVLLYFSTFVQGIAQMTSMASNPVVMRILTGGVSGALVSKETVQSYKDLADALRIQAEQAREAGNAAVAAAAGVGQLGTKSGATKIAVKAMAAGSEEAAKAAEKLKKEIAEQLKDEAAESYKNMTDELKGFAKDGADEAAESLKGMTEEAKALDAADLKQTVDEGAESMEKMKEEAKDLKESVADFGKTFGEAFKSLPGVILGAIQGGGNVAEAAGSHLGTALGKFAVDKLGTTITGMLGQTLGAGLNSILPGLGSILGAGLGSLVGRIGGAIGGLFRNGEIEKLNDMRDAFFEARGGWQAFAQEMERAGQADWAGKIFRAKTVEEFNALVREAEGLLGAHSESQEALNDAVQRYGFTIDELGPKWKQQELDKLAGSLLKDYELLVASGIDVNTVIERMGPNLLEYVNTARAAGGAIPEAMRPVIEQLIASGQLLDENGQAFTSVEDAGISFTQSLTEGLASVIEEIRNLVAALTGIPRDLPPIRQPVIYDDPGRPVAYHDPERDMPSYASGIAHVPRDGMAYLHRGEKVVPASQNNGGDALRDEVAGLRSDMRNLDERMARAFRHAIQTT